VFVFTMPAKRVRLLFLSTALMLALIAGLRGAGLQSPQQQRPAPQPPKNLSGTGVLSGRVMDAASGQPIPGALVQLTLSSATTPSDANTLGAFTIRNLGGDINTLSLDESAPSLTMLADA